MLPPAPQVKTATVRPFAMDRRTVSNADFARFVAQHRNWRRDAVARVFADGGYLQHWSSATTPGAAIDAQPVTQVSWFAAKAYCEAQGARLPSWHEWEFVAAASAYAADARADPQWRQAILDWYARPATARTARGGQLRAQLLRRARRARRGVGVGAGPGIDDGVGGQSRTG